jgi:3-methyladenine DNA glycosylase AlkD
MKTPLSIRKHSGHNRVIHFAAADLELRSARRCPSWMEIRAAHSALECGEVNAGRPCGARRRSRVECRLQVSSMDAATVVAALRAQADPANVEGMASYGISRVGTLGVPVKMLRRLAKEAGRSHQLAAGLWRSGIHEARIMASLVEEVERVTPCQMDRWVRGVDSWDVCDQLCQNLFRYTPFAFEKAAEWARAQPEFVRRAGFSLMAGLAHKLSTAPDERYEAFLPLIVEAATDERKMVRKSVNWALRQIGKRNPRLRVKAMRTAECIGAIDSRSARWVASDALRELRSLGCTPAPASRT